jgi:hypothetical protein
MAALMPRSIAEHEVAHLLGAAVAFIGGSNRHLKHFCDHPRYHDAACFVGYDAAQQQGEFAVIVSKYSAENGPMTDEQIDLIRRSSAIAPIGLTDDCRVMKSIRTAAHWLDVLKDFDDILSAEDRQIAIKGGLQIKQPDELIGAFAWTAAQKICPHRIDAIVGIIQQHGGSNGTLPIKQFVPRQLAIDIKAEALKLARSCFACANA